MRILGVLMTLAVLPVLVLGQGPPGTNLRVDVRVARIDVRGDTARVEYVVRNEVQSTEELFQFMVEAPAPVVRIAAPEPKDDWVTGTVVKTLSMATWGLLGVHLAPGAEAGPLAFEALGLPTIVPSYAGGWFPVPPYSPVEPGPSPAPRDAILANSVPGLTVGVEPFPADLSPASLLARLRGLADQSCALGWITKSGVCHSLQVKLDATAASLARGDPESAKGQLGAFLGELEAQHGPEPGKHVTDNAYWMLKVNAEFLRGRL